MIFKETNLTCNMFEEFSLTHLTGQKEELPSMIRIGSFNRSMAVPAFLPFDVLNGLCFETNPQTQNAVLKQMQYIALSIIKQVTPNLLRISFVDIGLNTNFPLIHSLKAPNINFITNRKALKEEIDNLFETARYISSQCLGFDYMNLNEYNNVCEHKEPYNILFISNFPKEFREEDINTVSMLINEGMKCGIYVIMNIDKTYFPEINNYNQEHFSNLLAITKQMIHIDCTKEKIELNNFNVAAIQAQFSKFPFVFESYSQNELADLMSNLNQSLTKTMFQSDNFLSIPIGRSGRQEVFFEMGEKADVYHGLIAGRTRTGKSTLLNNIITSIANIYSPNEMRLYLLDYKQGVEFQMFENHPNVELLLLDNSNFMIGVEALQQLQKEIIQRAKLFRELGPEINNIEEYNKKSAQKLPRILLIIDEVQQLFIAFESRKFVNPLVKEIAKQGAGFGIHMLFSSQSYMDCKIDDDTLSQMSLRISYNLANGRECRAILGGDNDIPTKLDRFHAVYNSKNGDKDANLIVKMSNFEKDKIISFLAEATIKHKDCNLFKKKIIVRDEENEDGTKTFSSDSSIVVKTVKRDIKVNNEDWSSWDNFNK